MQHRKLKVGEKIKKGDEFTRGRFNPAWYPCQHNVGEKYDPKKHWEVRRARGGAIADKFAAEHMENMRMAAEQQLTDALTFGQGFAKQTGFPPKIEHIKYGDIIRTKDVT